MEHDFGRYLADLIAQKGTSQRAFARSVGLRQAALYLIIHRSRKPPLKRIVPMADSLGLRGGERTRFLDLAYLCHTPEHVQRLLADALKKLAAIETRGGRPGGRGGEGDKD